MKKIIAETQEVYRAEWNRRSEENKDKVDMKLKEYISEVKKDKKTATIDCKDCGKTGVEAATFVWNGKERTNSNCIECDFHFWRGHEGCEVCTCPAAPATVLYCMDVDGHPKRGDEFLFCADCGHMTLLGWGQYRWACTVPEQMFAAYWMDRSGVSPKDVARDVADAEESGSKEEMEEAMIFENIASRLQKEYAECDCGHEHAMGVVHWDQDSQKAFYEDKTIDTEDINRAFRHIYHNYEQPLPVGFTKYAVCCGKRTPGTIPLADLEAGDDEE